VKLVYGPFLPDLPPHGSPGVSDVANVYPSQGGYRPVGQWVAHSDALPSACRGSAAFVAPSGRVSIIAGTATKLYRQDGVTWDELTLAAPTLNVTSTSTSGGTLAAATYYYKITAITPLGETLASNERSQVTTGATSSNTLTWPAVSGATGYRVYRGTAAGVQTHYYALGNVLTYVDTNAAATAGTPPVAAPLFNLGTTNRWRFVQFGELAIATNGADALVKINLETDALNILGGSPPEFEAMAVVSNFVVGTRVDGQVNKLAWSGENNAEWWTFAQRKSDYQELPDGGEITGIIGGEVGLILQRNAVRRMAYVGGNVLFRFDKISANVGCASVHSVAQHGELAFWHSFTGFKMWDGAQIKSIGFEKVDNAFASGYGAINYETMSTAVDGQKHTVCWSTGRMCWIYNWALDRWSIIDFDAQIITQRETEAPHLEEQDPIIGAPDDDVDGVGLDPFDSGRFIGGDPAFYVFNTSAQLGTFSGENMEASITGRAVEMVPGRDVYIRRVRPMTDAISGLTIRLDTRQRLGDGPRRTDCTTLQASGEMPTRARGRFAVAKLSIAADEAWTYIQGVDATVSIGGRR
jgi:hypothetical protein